MKKYFQVVVLASALVACADKPPESRTDSKPLSTLKSSVSSSPKETGFQSLRDKLIQDWLGIAPGWGRHLGMHEYDGKLADYSKAGLKMLGTLLNDAKVKLEGVDSKSLSADDALDLAILKGEVRLALFNFSERARHETDPRFYKELFDVSSYINFNYAPLEQRALRLVEHQEAALRQVDLVMANLRPVLSRSIVETAIKMYGGYAEYLRGDVQRLMSKVGDAAFQMRFEKANSALAGHAETFAALLKTRFLPVSDDTSHVLGVEKYKRFVAAQEGFEPVLADFKKLAEDDLARNKKAYLTLTSNVTVTRPRKEKLLEAATTLMEASRQFVIEKKLVGIPSNDPCVLKETPPYMRWNAAFLNMAGPFDKVKQAFYYITLPNEKWPKKKQDAYIFPWGVLQATTVHEVYPGHFLHGLWQRNAPTKVQKMMSSYSFTEGWAHYAEQMMVEQGFGGDDPQNHLGQLTDALLRNCRFVVSIGVHTEGMTLLQAQKRFMEDCFQDEASAKEQAVRATFDPGYFAYTIGKLKILELREELKREMGDKFDLRSFHDVLLSHGAPPLALIRERVKREVLGQQTKTRSD